MREDGLPVERFHPSHQPRYRVVVLQKLYDPEHLVLAKQLQAQKTKIVFDLCDNHFFNPTNDPTWAQQAEWLQAMLNQADVVTVPTAALAERLGRPCVVIRDGVEPCPPAGWLSTLPRRRAFIELVWYGIARGSRGAGGLCDLLEIADTLGDLAQQFALRLTVISNSEETYRRLIAPLDFPTRYRSWKSHANLCRLLPLHDVCLLPLSCNPFTVCKSCNRLALALFLGVPVVATAIPSYREFGDFCILDDWHNGLRAYLESQTLRRQHAEAGGAYVRAHYTIQKAASEWRQLFEELL